ncbi:hypothetical protein B0H63DRAFT_184731 [Podospora didyma]|uniref:Uncharacterized protein n=1 Tax=Podospora didyma TaxID=330526 RepID=A0AAE0NQ01_9PEZI|nr:hypothetical protein B0H63DRAFT_184731 [Podospora didyma]
MDATKRFFRGTQILSRENSRTTRRADRFNEQSRPVVRLPKRSTSRESPSQNAPRLPSPRQSQEQVRSDAKDNVEDRMDSKTSTPSVNSFASASAEPPDHTFHNEQAARRQEGSITGREQPVIEVTQDQASRENGIGTMEASLELERLRTALDEANRRLEEQNVAHADEMTAKTQQIERLRAKATEAASRAAEESQSVEQWAALRVPESEIIKRWQTLCWEVHNFVLNYACAKGDTRKIAIWAQRNREVLRDISPRYKALLGDKQACKYFIEAAVLEMLRRLVLRSSSMCWAGKYAGRVSRLSEYLSSAVNKGGEPEKERTFHQWRALTTSLLSIMGPDLTGCGETAGEVTDELEAFLESLRSSSNLFRNNGHTALRAIVDKAIALDEIFCGQQELYQLLYPVRRYDFKVDRASMEIAEGSSEGQVVWFMITPSLYRSGGRGDSYDEIVRVDNSLVWV